MKDYMTEENNKKFQKICNKPNGTISRLDFDKFIQKFEDDQLEVKRSLPDNVYSKWKSFIKGYNG